MLLICLNLRQVIFKTPVKNSKRNIFPKSGRRLYPDSGCQGYTRKRIWSRLTAPEAHQKRDDLIPPVGTRGWPEEGWSGSACWNQKLTRRGMILSRLLEPEANQKRDDLVLPVGTIGWPEEGWSGPNCWLQRITRRGMFWSRLLGS